VRALVVSDVVLLVPVNLKGCASKSRM
jgi:hypothetical protein